MVSITALSSTLFSGVLAFESYHSIFNEFYPLSFFGEIGKNGADGAFPRNLDEVQNSYFPFRGMNLISKIMGFALEVITSTALTFLLGDLIGRLIPVDKTTLGLRLLLEVARFAFQAFIAVNTHAFVKTLLSSQLTARLAHLTTETLVPDLYF